MVAALPLLGIDEIEVVISEIHNPCRVGFATASSKAIRLDTDDSGGMGHNIDVTEAEHGIHGLGKKEIAIKLGVESTELLSEDLHVSYANGSVVKFLRKFGLHWKHHRSIFSK